MHVLRLRRNVGHQKAITIGLSYLQDKILDSSKVVIMDSDGEDRPETIDDVIKKLDNDLFDVVVSARGKRVESLKFRLFYQIYRWIFKFLTGYSICFGNYMAMKSDAMKRLLTYSELSTHIAGTVILSKCRIHFVPIDRGPRYAGQSKMNFSGLVLHGLRALMIFSDYVLVRIGLASIISIGFIGIVIIAIVALKSIGMATPGWFSILLGILIILSIQLAAFVLMFLVQSSDKNQSSEFVNEWLKFIDKVDQNY